MNYILSSPEPSMAAWNATQGPGSCSKKADIAGQLWLTALMEEGKTPYCGCSSFSLCSFFALGCRLAWLAGLFPRPTPGIFTTCLGSGFGSFSGRTT